MTRFLIILIAVFSALTGLGRSQSPRPTLPCGSQPVTGETEAQYHRRCPDGDDSLIDNSETRIPPTHFCVTREVYQDNQRRTGRTPETAHPCDCKMACHKVYDDQGNSTEEEQEGNECLAFCHKNNRACTCHVEEPCPGSVAGANELVDMDGNTVAMLKGTTR